MQMTVGEYKAIQDQLHLFVTMARNIAPERLNEFILEAEHGLTITPFIDPTAYLMGANSLQHVIDTAKAFRVFVRAVALEDIDAK